MEFTKETNELITKLYEGRNHVELTIGVLKNGKKEIVHFDENRNLSEEKLIYPVGSIGKPFTASLLSKLVSEGKVELESPLNKYIKGLPERYYPSIKRMLTHHSGYGGLPYSFVQTLLMFAKMNNEDGILHVNPFRGYPDEKAMLELLKSKKLNDKEYKFAYSNFAFGVLGYIIGKVMNTDYFTAMEGYVKELGLNDTSLSNSNMIGYDKKGNPCKPWQWEKGDIIAPAGALLSSIDDLLKFAEINMDGEHSYLDICHVKHADGEKTFDQGLAWRLKKDSSISYHVGNAGAFSCILAIDREKKEAAAIGLNYAMVEIEDLAFSILK